jgi:hypothetical protein
MHKVKKVFRALSQVQTWVQSLRQQLLEPE